MEVPDSTYSLLLKHTQSYIAPYVQDSLDFISVPTLGKAKLPPSHLPHLKQSHHY